MSNEFVLKVNSTQNADILVQKIKDQFQNLLSKNDMVQLLFKIPGSYRNQLLDIINF